ncbi:MAG: PQQ-binding-like beta-propeller repeat protein, partial [Pseudomonadales bacterium]|nr:PQQ-binding-like beta-propeller repeat protein [Pseudomonadales bacterium]
MRSFNFSWSVICVLLALCGPVSAEEPIVIAHRGASGYLPEHTLAAYERAIELGADYIEPDLVITKDGVLIARHDHYLGTTTNVADHEEFADRRKVVGGREEWFTEDFTLAEIKTLRARQAFPGRSKEYDDRYEIPTLQEVIDLVKRKSAEVGRDVGLYPETKEPAHFRSLGFDFAALLLATLERNGIASGVYIQSFEAEILRELNGRTDLPLVQLITPAAQDEPNQPNIPLDEIATYADGIGTFKVLLVNEAGGPSEVVSRARDLGLFVHAWTFRDDAWPKAFFPTARAELAHFLNLGIDGFFTDFPDTGVAVRDRFLANRPASGEWRHFGGSQHGDQYSALDLIDRDNVGELVQAWVYRTGELSEGARRNYAFQSNPILVRGSLYLTTGSGIVVALNPETGEEKWRYDPKLDRTKYTSEVANRGVTSWIDPARADGEACAHRIFTGLLDSRLIALDGETGEPCADFGEGGTIHLNRGVRLRTDGTSFDYSVTSPPVIVHDLVISDSAIGDNRAVELELGIVRGFDARHGELRWSWDPVPRDP